MSTGAVFSRLGASRPHHRKRLAGTQRPVGGVLWSIPASGDRGGLLATTSTIQIDWQLAVLGQRRGVLIDRHRVILAPLTSRAYASLTVRGNPLASKSIQNAQLRCCLKLAGVIGAGRLSAHARPVCVSSIGGCAVGSLVRAARCGAPLSDALPCRLMPVDRWSTPSTITNGKCAATLCRGHRFSKGHAAGRRRQGFPPSHGQAVLSLPQAGAAAQASCFANLYTD